MSYTDDLQYLIAVGKDGSPEDRANAWADADAADDATERLTYADGLTAGELIRYVRMIEALPDESFEADDVRAKRDEIATRIRKIERDTKAADHAG